MRIDRPITIAVGLFIVLVLVFFLVAPEYRTFKKLQLDLGEKKAQYNAEFNYYAEVIKKYYELKNMEGDLKKIDNALPEDPDLGKLIYYFQKTAVDSGMLIRNLFLSSTTKSSDVNRSKNSGNINELVFSMDVMGSYSSLGIFLASLEKSDRIFETTSISFQTEASAGSLQSSSQNPPSGQFQAQQIYNFNLQVKTHSY
ncbi:MAG: type 4a pilus biogenesis protein PilO [bacterium]